MIISTVGTIGNCAVVDETILPANSDRHVGIIRVEKDFRPHFLSTFILSKYGRFQTIRESTGNVQLNLFIYKIRTLKIPFLSSKFQQQVERLVQSAHLSLNQSKTIYQQAQDLLLSELGLKDWQPTEETVAVKSFAESFLSSGRLDAEYYQPKYDEIEQHIKKYSGGWDYLGNKFLVETGEYSEEYFEKSENLKFYIRNTNIVKGQINIDDSYYVNPKIFSKFVQEGDILTARVGAIGSFGTIEKELNGSIYSDNVLSLRRIQSECLLPDVYTLYFNTKPNRQLMDKFSGGSVQPLITQTSIKSLPIPIFNFQFQHQLHLKIIEGFEFNKKSKQLLEIAKTGVERAIETDEATATAWINQQLEALEVKLT